MTPAIGLLVIGGILLVSGWKGASLVDTFAGNFTSPADAATPSNGTNGSNAPVAPQSGTYGRLVSPGLQFAGPDQGIDFTGKGSIYAPARLKITRINLSSGWPGGHLIVARILDGVHAGRFVYFAEALNPVNGLRQGQVLSAGQKIADLNSSYPGTEIGWAKDANGTAYGSTSDGKNGNAAPYGVAFGNWIKSLTRSNSKNVQRP